MLFGRGGATCSVYMNDKNIRPPIGLKALKEKWPEHFSKPLVSKDEICKFSEKAAKRRAEIFSKPCSTPPDVKKQSDCNDSKNDPEIMIIDSNVCVNKDNVIPCNESEQIERMLVSCLKIKQEIIEDMDIVEETHLNCPSLTELADEWEHVTCNSQTRFYLSNIIRNDILRCNTKKWVVTSSTLAYVNKRTNDENNIISIECPGATINEMLKPLLNEMTCIKNVENVKLAFVGGVNNFLRNKQTVEEIKAEAKNAKEKIKAFNSNISVNFIGIPLIPQCSKLPYDNHILDSKFNDRTNDILNFNSYVTSVLNDTSTLLTLENYGIESPTSFHDTYSCSSNVKIGKLHIQSQWQEKNLTFGVHLSKDLKRKFWNEHIRPFFDLK